MLVLLMSCLIFLIGFGFAVRKEVRYRYRWVRLPGSS